MRADLLSVFDNETSEIMDPLTEEYWDLDCGKYCGNHRGKILFYLWSLFRCCKFVNFFFFLFESRIIL